MSGIVDEVRLRLRRRALRHTFHALKEEMAEGLTAIEIEKALVARLDLVEDYPEDPRGHSCLVLTRIRGKPVHIVCAPHEEALIIVTVYSPSPNDWKEDYKTRRRRQ